MYTAVQVCSQHCKAGIFHVAFRIRAVLRGFVFAVEDLHHFQATSKYGICNVKFRPTLSNFRDLHAVVNFEDIKLLLTLQ